MQGAQGRNLDGPSETVWDSHRGISMLFSFFLVWLDFVIED